MSFKIISSNQNKINEYKRFGLSNLEVLNGKDIREVAGTSEEVISYKSLEAGEENKFNVCDRCGTEIEKGSYGWYGEYDGQQMCYNCYDSY